MRFSQLQALVLATLATSLVGCSTGSSISTITQNAAAPPPSGQTPSGFTQSIKLSPSGGTFALKLPAGYTGSLTVGANNAPAGTAMEVGLVGAFASSGSGLHINATTQTDPFPIVITIKLPFTITLPIPGFSITFPSWVNLAQGTFDVSFYDPTQPVSYTSPTNPTLLGKATASGQTLTFVPAVQKFTFKKGVAYSETIARDTGGTGVVLPLPSGVNNQNLPPNGTIGGSSVNTTSSASTFTQWVVAPFGNVLNFQPGVASAAVRRNITNPTGTSAQGVESLIVQATGATTLTNTILNFTFNPSGQPPITGGPGTFPPGTGPVLGPYSATCTPGTGCSATVTDPVALAAGAKFGFELFTVTICAPVNVYAPCDSSNPGPPSNARTQLSGDNQQYDVLVSDQSETLNGLYSVSLTGSMPDGSALPPGVAPCSFVPEASDNLDRPGPPWPVYNDNWPTANAGQAPNSEFEVNTGGPIPEGGDACTWIVSYNGEPMAADNIGIGVALTPQMKTRLMHRFIVKPPVNGPHVGGGG
jgi:hypothetical protein